MRCSKRNVQRDSSRLSPLFLLAAIAITLCCTGSRRSRSNSLGLGGGDRVKIGNRIDNRGIFSSKYTYNSGKYAKYGHKAGVYGSRRDSRCGVLASYDDPLYQTVKQEVLKLKAKELKAELKERGVELKGMLEKDTLIEQVVLARLDAGEIDPFNKLKRKGAALFEKTANDVKEKGSAAVESIKSFDLKAELNKQVDIFKDGIKENVDWYGAGSEAGEENPFTAQRVIRRQRGFRKGGDDIS
mmetsp:Transcript_6455/g.11899  ORF Transcript_6455/g.11899 Transcript_6455/m.11899 type:complete len:242 (-) Transcript_6455:33-758(-)